MRSPQDQISDAIRCGKLMEDQIQEYLDLQEFKLDCLLKLKNVFPNQVLFVNFEEFVSENHSRIASKIARLIGFEPNIENYKHLNLFESKLNTNIRGYLSVKKLKEINQHNYYNLVQESLKFSIGVLE